MTDQNIGTNQVQNTYLNSACLEALCKVGAVKKYRTLNKL